VTAAFVSPAVPQDREARSIGAERAEERPRSCKFAGFLTIKREDLIEEFDHREMRQMELR